MLNYLKILKVLIYLFQCIHHKIMSISFGIVLIIVERAEREFIPKVMTHRQFSKVIVKLLNFIGLKFILIDKSCQSYQLEYLSRLRNKGNYIIVAEEEAWVPFDVDDFLCRRLPNDAADVIDELWIPHNAPIKNYIPKAFKTFNITHPRTVIAEKSYKEALIIEGNKNIKFGVVLFVSSFGLLSSDVDFLNAMAVDGTNIDIEKYKNIYKDLQIRFEHFTKIIKYFNDCAHSFQVKVRPHPAEIGLWEQFVSDKRIMFDYGDYIESIAKSDLIVHSGSTVAFDIPEMYKSKVIYVAPQNSQFYLFPKYESGKVIESDPRSTALEIFEIYEKIDNVRQINNSESSKQDFIPDSEILANPRKISLVCQLIINSLINISSIVYSIVLNLINKNNSRENKKINVFFETCMRVTNRKGNYYA